MSNEYQVQRHSAYFKGWCQAFGEHESVADEGLYWLYGGDQIGVLLPLKKGQEPIPDLHEMEAKPLLTLEGGQLCSGGQAHALVTPTSARALMRIREMLDAGQKTHIYLTSHFMYGPGPKIITLSNKRPLTIIYKEIGPMRVRLD